MSSRPDGERSDTPPAREPAARREALRVAEIMALIAGLAIGMWLIATSLPPKDNEKSFPLVLILAAGVLGGLSLVGLPLLLWERREGRRRFGAGKLLWFTSGTAAWLLWPPVIVRRVNGTKFSDSESALCFAYGTPLMALYVTAALVAGGWLGRRGRRRLRRSWREQFGLYLGLLWACTGLYALYEIYSDEFSR